MRHDFLRHALGLQLFTGGIYSTRHTVFSGYGLVVAYNKRDVGRWSSHQRTFRATCSYNGVWLLPADHFAAPPCGAGSRSYKRRSLYSNAYMDDCHFSVGKKSDVLQSLRRHRHSRKDMFYESVYVSIFTVNNEKKKHYHQKFIS
jgi:hypothetical protein